MNQSETIIVNSADKEWPQTSKEDGKSLTKKVDKNNIHFSILKSTNSQVAEGGKPQDLAPQYPWWLRGQAYSGS